MKAKDFDLLMLGLNDALGHAKRRRRLLRGAGKDVVDIPLGRGDPADMRGMVKAGEK